MSNDDLRTDISWINMLKAFCMLIIYFNHSEYYLGWHNSVIDYIYSPFFVNSFFILSGYLLLRKQLSSPICIQNVKTYITTKTGGGKMLFKNIVFKLLLPSIIFASVLFFPKIIIRGNAFNLKELINGAIFGGCYWYTSALIVAELSMLIALIPRISKLTYLLIIGIILLFSSDWLSFHDVMFLESDYLPFYYKSGMIAFSFLVAGGYYYAYEATIDKMFIGRRRLLLIILLCVYLYIVINLNNGIHVTITNGHWNVLGLSLILISSFLLIQLCKLLPSISIINYIGRHTIGLYFFCGAFPNIIAVLFLKFRIIPTFFSVLICCIMSFVIAIICNYYLEKYLPFIFDLRKLIRKN